MPDKTADLPFQPIRNHLYTSAELLQGFMPDDPQSMARTPDFNCFHYFVVSGRATPRDPYASMMEGLHDNSINRSLYGVLDRIGKPTAAIMGGHREERGSKTYRDVVAISKKLSEAGFLMASGGGPGAMEATHLGGLLAGATDRQVKDAIDLLAAEPKLPDSMAVVSPDGVVNTEIVAQIHKWAAPAVKLMKQYPNGGSSLAVPTWHYGHEPLSPLATHVAKYFLNSIREDVLLALATNGIVYTQGRAGTLQEVFQDAAQNYYAEPQDTFAPMVFFDTKFWRSTLPVEGLLQALFSLHKNGDATYKKKVLFTDKIDDVVDFLLSHRPRPEQAMKRLAALGCAPTIRAARTSNRLLDAGLSSVPTQPHLMNLAMDAAAWGIKRHSRIAGAAFARLRSGNARSAVTQICAAAGEASLASAATWADRIKTDPPLDPATQRFLSDDGNGAHGTWHYVNMPLGVTGYDRDQYPAFTRADDVVQMLLAAVEALCNPGANARFEEIIALRWLAHLVGDLHQPVHVGCGYISNMATSSARLMFDPVQAIGLLSDRGGNQIKLPGVGDLHSFWDSGLGIDDVQAPAEDDYAAFDIADVRQTVCGWANITLAQARLAYQGISIASYVSGSVGPKPDDPGDYVANWEGEAAYRTRCTPIAAERMSAAASNMAALLDAIWPE